MPSKKPKFIAVMLLAAASGLMQAAPRPQPWPAPYHLQKTYSTVGFTITKWMVFKEEGLFQDFSGTITYNSSNPVASSVEVTVQAASIDTRNSTRDGVLRSDDFFDVAKYPTLSFRSVSVTPKDTEMLEVTGDLAIHGVTRRITIPVKVLGTRRVPNVGDLAGFETSFTIDRRDYGVLGMRWSSGSLILDNTVNIHILAGATR